jgi:hypothetical protein
VTGAAAGASAAPSTGASIAVEMGTMAEASRLSVAVGRLLVEGGELISAAADGVAGVVDCVGVSVDRSAVGGVVAVAAGIGLEAALPAVVLLAVALPEAVAVAVSAAPPAAVPAAVVAPAVAEADEDVLALAVSSLSMSVTCTRKNASTTGSSFDNRDVRVD